MRQPQVQLQILKMKGPSPQDDKKEVMDSIQTPQINILYSKTSLPLYWNIRLKWDSY